jgi:hypothetical protein
LSTPKKKSAAEKTKIKKTAVPKTKTIGTKNESSLHRTLKFRYAGEDGKTEETAGDFVADGKRADGEYIEVQTGSFGPLKKKVKELALKNKVRIIHPTAQKKTIEVYKPGKKSVLLYCRKSPLKGTLWNLFDALLYAPELPLLSRVSVEAVMVEITENRIKDGKGSWRRKGISIKDRELTSWRESVHFKKPKDYLRFIPFKKNEEFTTSSLSQRAGVDIETARKALYVLTKMKVVRRTGKKGNSWIYLRS